MDKIMPEPADNPLRDFDAWMADPSTFPSHKWFVERGFARIGSRRFDMDESVLLARTREWFISKYGFSLPTREVIAELCQLQPLLEVGAGSGYWSRILYNAGADIVATDKVKTTLYGFKIGRHFEVQQRDAVRAVRDAYPNRNVLMSWPCYDQDWSARAAEAMQPGRTLALIGEGPGGCTGSARLFEVIESQFEPIECRATVAQFPGINDYLDLYRKK